VGYTDIYGQPFAQKLVQSAAAIRGYARSTTAAVGQMISMYAKAGEWSRLCLGIANGSGLWSVYNFNLLTGTFAIGASYGGTLVDTPAMVYVGNGWYRCSVRVSATGGTDVVALPFNQNGDPVNPSPSLIGDGTSGIYIFGAQLSDSASVDPYVYNPVAAPTGTAYYGPRFDYDPVTLAPKGLLIEEQRTNLQIYSGQMSDVSWSTSRVTVTANAAVAPDGTSTATLFVETGGGTSYVRRVAAVSPNTTYTTSVYAKANASTTFVMVEAGVTGSGASFVLSGNGSVVVTNLGGSASATITLVGNGWYRCTFTYTTGAAQTTLFVNNQPTSCFLWGAQLEAGAFATSYIPTVASQVTRAADSAPMIGNNFARWYNVNEGSVFADFIPSQNANTPSIWGQSTADTSGGYFAAQLNHWNGTATLGNSGVITLNRSNKTAIAYTGTASRAGVANASAVTTSATTIGTFNTIRLGATGGGTQFLNGTIKRFAFYPRRLANTELQSITA
jgi:hypothetical protein